MLLASFLDVNQERMVKDIMRCTGLTIILGFRGEFGSASIQLEPDHLLGSFDVVAGKARIYKFLVAPFQFSEMVPNFPIHIRH